MSRRKFPQAAMLLVLTLFTAACSRTDSRSTPSGSGNEPGDHKQSVKEEATESNVLPTDLKKRAGLLSGAKLLCFIQDPSTIVYALQAKNNTGGALETDSTGYLFLLDANGKNFVRLSQAVEKKIDQGGDIGFVWKLPVNSPVGSRWRKEFTDPDVLQGRRFHSGAPFSLAFVSTPRGALEVSGSESVEFALSVGEDQWRTNQRTLEDGDARSIFEKASVELPPK